MTQQQHIRNIRKQAELKGQDLILPLSLAGSARILADQISEKDCVVWSDQDGGLSWTALDRPAGTDHSSIDTVYSVRRSAESIYPKIWNRLEKHMKDRGIRLKRIILSETIDISTAVEPADSQSGADGILLRILKQLVRKLTTNFTDTNAPAAVESAENSSEASRLNLWMKSDDREPFLYPAVTAGNHEEISSVFPALKSDLLSEHTGKHSNLYLLDGKLPMEERFHLAECIAGIGCVPLVLIRSAEGAQAISQIESMRKRDLRVILSVKGLWEDVSPFCSLSDFPILSPASANDGFGGLSWLLENRQSGLIFESSHGSYTDRVIFKSPWKSGSGIVFRESTKGNAGKVLLIVPGDMAVIAAKAADKLVKDNISVSVLSMRFLSPLNKDELTKEVEKTDVCVVAESQSFTGDLRDRLSRYFQESVQVDMLMALPGCDASGLADTASNKLRENRIQRTVDDVKADRWR